MRLHLLLLALLLAFAGPARAQQSAARSAPNGAPSPADTASQERPGPPPEFAPAPADRPLRGVVWRPPADPARAARELRRIDSAGVEAVRTPLLRRERLLTLADTLRLRLFQDLPATYLAARALEERLPMLRWELERALLQARRHPSARHFGLLLQSDTSVPSVCEGLRELTARLRAYGPAGSAAYYQTPFTKSDRCADAADLVLLNTLDEEAPQARLQRWVQAHRDADSSSASASAVGLGAVGTWVDPAADGLKAPHSPQAQARYFEQHLPPLLHPDSARADSSGSSSPRVVFVYRWSNRAAAPDSAARNLSKNFFSQDNPYGRRYGLLGEGGTARPALDVVRGLYTGRQQVFAFQAGEAPPGRFPWMVLVGWGLVAVLGVFYASAPRVRGMVRRYFRSPGFYRQSVQEGRQALTGAGLVLLGGVSICGGLVVTVFLLAVQETGPFVQLLRGGSETMQGAMQALLAYPWLAVLVISVFYALSLSLWAFLLSLVSGQGRPMRTEQVLVLVVWPRWPALLLAAGAVVATTLPPETTLLVAAILLGLWVVVSVVAVVRTLYDFLLLTGLSPALAPALVLLNPVVLAVVMALFAVLEILPEARFLWHLAMRS